MDYQGRRDEFRRHMTDAGLDACLVLSRANLRYLSGFTGEDSALLILDDGAVLVTDGRFTEQAEEETDLDQMVCRRGPMGDTLAELVNKRKPARLGLTTQNTTLALWMALHEKLEDCEARAITTGIAEQMRVCKDADEVQAIRRALALSQQVMEEFLPRVEPGRTERWLGANLEFQMRAFGAEGPSFPTICAVGASASKPHAVTSQRAVEPDCAVMFDWGVVLNGYCSDLTRVTHVGTIPGIVQELAEIVLAAQEAAIDVLKPGMRCADVDAAARSVISEAGYGDAFNHGLGHGVGLEVHEAPRLGPNSQETLRPGMVVTIEPGIYLPGRAGVRIEEMALITETGHQVLSTMPRRPAQLPAGPRHNKP